MKLTTILLSLLLLSLLAFPCGSSALHHASAAQQHSHNGHKPFANVIDGSHSPSLISDTVAYELFLRSLVFRADEASAAESRHRALAEELNLSIGEIRAIVLQAQAFAQAADIFDRKAAQIKEKHLPNLTPQDAGELLSLQKRKEALLDAAITAFPRKLGADISDRLRAYVGEHVKRGIRSVQPVRPTDEGIPASGARRGLRLMAARYAPAQNYNGVGMYGYGHLYMNGWKDMTEGYVYQRSIVTEDYNVYGHRWSVQTKVYSPERTRVASTTYEYYPATTSSTVRIDIGIDDGEFSIETILKQMCPYLGLLGFAALPGDPIVIPPIVRISAISFAQNPIARQGGSTEMQVQVAASRGVPRDTDITVEVFQNTNPNQASLSVAPNNGENGGKLNPGQVTIVPFTVTTPNGVQTSSGLVTYAARITSLEQPPPPAQQINDLTPATGTVSPPLCIGSRLNNQTCEP